MKSRLKITIKYTLYYNSAFTFNDFRNMLKARDFIFLLLSTLRHIAANINSYFHGNIMNNFTRNHRSRTSKDAKMMTNCREVDMTDFIIVYFT